MRMLLEFRKDDSVRHLGLLDLQRTMQRALRRSGLPLSYSQGFNPHINMSFASALSVGIPGDAELLDVALVQDVTAEECLEKMNSVLPPALRASRVVLIDDKHPALMKMLKQASYEIDIQGDTAVEIGKNIEAFLASEEIMALRKSKRAEKLVNIRPMIHELTYAVDEFGIHMYVRVSFEELATCKPEMLVKALCDFAGVDNVRASIRRKCLFGEKDGQVIPLIEL